MTLLKFTLPGLALAVIATSASAQFGPPPADRTYIAVGVDAVEFDSYNISAKLGYDLNANFALEAQAGFGVIDDEDDLTGIDYGVDINVAAFLVAKTAITPRIDIFSRTGYHYTEVGASSAVGEATFDSDGFAFGGGAQYWLDPARASAIRAEYTNYDLDFGSADFWSLSYVRRF